MNRMVVIDLKNKNALISMALVAQNAADNPYGAFCEYIKYCIFTNPSDLMTITQLKEAVIKEFGLYMPSNVMIRCIESIRAEGTVDYSDHQISRIGFFDTTAFDKERLSFKETERNLIDALVKYATKYNRDWSNDEAREQLVKVLDRGGLAFDIFVNEKETGFEYFDSLHDEEETLEGEESEPLFTDSFLVARFLEEIIAEDSYKKEYLLKICEGLMLCVGVYQIPAEGAVTPALKIDKTEFFFDTRLLLRFVGCAGQAAVESVKELVSLIQEGGGKICYYPQTLEEMERAFDKAISSLANKNPPYDDEMRLFATKINNSVAILEAKKANLKGELSEEGIHIRQHEVFSDSDRIKYGFDYSDFQQFMRGRVKWDKPVIDNDSLAIWETHMRRQGNYDEYCGTSLRLPVFVTTNDPLLRLTLDYKEERPQIKSIQNWKRNRLPIINDIRLTCRLWCPSTQKEKMSLLYLSANVVAAKKPTKRYLNTIRDQAIQLRDNVPDYSGLCLPSFFDDKIANTIFEKTLGLEENFNIGSLAASISEITEWKAKEQEEKTKQVESERDELRKRLDEQKKQIIQEAVEKNKNRLGWRRFALWIALKWEYIVGLLFVGLSAGLALFTGEASLWLIILVPAVLYIVEHIITSNVILKKILKWILPRIEKSFSKKVVQNLKKTELEYKDDIVETVKENTDLLVRSNKFLKEE